jgi:putative SOS response-associated peptidase YedK
MCGRFVLRSDLSVIEDAFGIEEISGVVRQSNPSVPGQRVIAVTHDVRRRLVLFQWGLIPSWAKDRMMGRKLFNARAETVAEKPSFRSAFKKRRCLICADGFYEWHTSGKVKTPYLFYLKSGEPFGFAGLYESWVSPEGQIIDTCTIITTEPNDLIRPIHDRMPVMIPKDKESIWLDPAVESQALLRSLLIPYSADEMAIMNAADLK